MYPIIFGSFPRYKLVLLLTKLFWGYLTSVRFPKLDYNIGLDLSFNETGDNSLLNQSRLARIVGYLSFLFATIGLNVVNLLIRGGDGDCGICGIEGIEMAFVTCFDLGY